MNINKMTHQSVFIMCCLNIHLIYLQHFVSINKQNYVASTFVWYVSQRSSQLPLVLVLSRFTNQDRNVGVVHDVVTDAAQQGSANGAHAPRANHNQAGLVCSRYLAHHLSWVASYTFHFTSNLRTNRWTFIESVCNQTFLCHGDKFSIKGLCCISPS